MRQLGSLEAGVMQHLWSASAPMSVRDVLHELQRDRDIAYTTVMTVLDNLHRKKLVVRSKLGRAYVYSPTQSREEHTAELMGSALTGAGAGDRGVALLRFVEQMSPDEITALRELLEKQGDLQGDEQGNRST